MDWKDNQLLAITEKNKDLLVSAAAGSGKTAVLIERIIRLILQDGADIDRFLVVTFTKAAASEMKEKIMAFLRLAAPALADGVRDLTGDWQYRDGDVWEINVHAPDENGDEGLPELIIRVLPEWKILKYSCLGNG